MNDHPASRIQSLLAKHLPAVEAMRDIGEVVLPPQKRGRKAIFGPEVINEWVRLYRRYTTTEIAEKFGVWPETVTYHIRKRVKMRKPGKRPSSMGTAAVIRSRQSSLVKLSKWLQQPRTARIKVLGRPAYEVLDLLRAELETAFQKKA